MVLWMAVHAAGYACSSGRYTACNAQPGRPLSRPPRGARCGSWPRRRTPAQRPRVGIAMIRRLLDHIPDAHGLRDGVGTGRRAILRPLDGDGSRWMVMGADGTMRARMSSAAGSRCWFNARKKSSPSSQQQKSPAITAGTTCPITRRGLSHSEHLVRSTSPPAASYPPPSQSIGCSISTSPPPSAAPPAASGSGNPAPASRADPRRS